MPAERWLEIAYKDFVRDLDGELACVLDLMELDVHAEQQRKAVAFIIIIPRVESQ